MTPDRKRHVRAVAPEEPQTPVAGNQPPAPAGRDARSEPGKPGASHADGEPGESRQPSEDREAAHAHESREAGQSSRGGKADAKGAETDIDDERQLERDVEELAAKADAYLELAQRTKAEFENYRKRAVREAAAAQERGVTKLALELLPAVDNLDRALMAADTGGNGSDTLVSGIKLVHADVIAALERVGIKSYSPVGERFDPQCHEAVAQQPVEGAEPGTVVEVYQRGYRLGEAVIRPARVVVAR